MRHFSLRSASIQLRTSLGKGDVSWPAPLRRLARTNALHAEPPTTPVDLVVIDLAWTPQRLALPAAGGARLRARAHAAHQEVAGLASCPIAAQGLAALARAARADGRSNPG